jgi:hypothetical protein
MSIDKLTQGLLADVKRFVNGITQLAVAKNQNVITGNTGIVTTGPQTATAVNVGGTSSRHTNAFLQLTATATSITSVVDPITMVQTNTVVTPLFTVVETVPPGVGALPFFTVTVVSPAITVSGQALTFTTVTDPVTMVQTVDAVMPTFTLHAIVTPGVTTPTIVVTLTIF